MSMLADSVDNQRFEYRVQVPRGAPASDCFKAGLSHIEQNQLTDAMSCFNEAFLALAKDQSLNIDVKPQAKICAQYKIAVLLLQVLHSHLILRCLVSETRFRIYFSQ